MNKFFDELYAWQYFVGAALTTVGNNWFFIPLQTNYSKVLTVTLGPENIGFYTGIFSAIGSSSRFVGPFIGSIIIYLTDTDGKPPCETQSDGKYLCCLENHTKRFSG
eukprot:TRINITY_DN1646_c0_g1_i1.p1 TRINITY_DN1646_c0_g1~~TRINITY_DN1646_c0_g1_i1.p1  ORF type:complete len:107 (+),score=2.70 TRINITY_DN1646_c0_g1_i1:54-374(+)